MKSTRNIRKILTTSIAAALATLGTTPQSEGQTSTWARNGSGNWSDNTGNAWAGPNIPATGANNTANFVLNITATTTVTQDILGLTIGNLVFTDLTTVSNDWVLAPGNSLTLDVTAGNSAISMTNAGRLASVNVPLLGNDGIIIPTTSLGTVSLGSNASAFTGTLTIANGATVSLGAGAAVAGVGGGTTGTTSSLGAGGAGNQTIVQAGGVLNINAQNTGNIETIQIAGFGNATIGGAALVNNGAGSLNALSTVELTADAAIGGTGRFDLRNNAAMLTLNGFRLTKIGANQFSVVNGTITDGHIDVAAGTFSVEANTSVQGSRSTTFNTGGTLGLWTNVANRFTRQLTKCFSRGCGMQVMTRVMQNSTKIIWPWVKEKNLTRLTILNSL